MSIFNLFKRQDQPPRRITGRPATAKQINYLRDFGVEPPADMTIGEASVLLDKLINDPKAQARKDQIQMERMEAEDDRKRKTPAPKGVGAKARSILKECQRGQVWIPELQNRFELILERTSIEAQAELREDFEERLQGINDVLDCTICDVSNYMEEMEEGFDREEKRLAAHNLQEALDECDKEVHAAKADLMTLIAWTKELLEGPAPDSRQARDEQAESTPPQLQPQDPPTLDGDAPAKKGRVRRVLSKVEAESEPGQLLCRAAAHFSEDSRLDVDEVRELRAIIDDTALSACVGIQELKATIDKALEDGALSGDECFELVYAIRNVLPKQTREIWDQRMRGPDRPATEAQLNYIEVLSGYRQSGFTVEQASKLIERLIAEREARQLS